MPGRRRRERRAADAGRHPRTRAADRVAVQPQPGDGAGLKASARQPACARHWRRCASRRAMRSPLATRRTITNCFDLPRSARLSNGAVRLCGRGRHRHRRRRPASRWRLHPADRGRWAAAGARACETAPDPRAHRRRPRVLAGGPRPQRPDHGRNELRQVVAGRPALRAADSSRIQPVRHRS